MRHAVYLLAFVTLLLPVTAARGEEAVPLSGLAPTSPPLGRDQHVLVEEYTAGTLAAGEVQLGTDFNVGLTSAVMIGTDLVAAAIGATTLSAKFATWKFAEDEIAFGLRGAYLNRNTLFWGVAGGIRDHYRTLDARIIRPSISWTSTLSPRLKLHVFWAKGFGNVNAELSDKGVRELWQKKHPGADYDQRDPETQQPRAGDSAAAPGLASANQERSGESNGSPTSETVQVQSITGLAQERFQMSGETTRANGNKVIVSCRIEESQFEQLHSSTGRLTIAHQWIWPVFQMRLGIGTQYYVLSGTDLDNEKVATSGWQPASDIAFYWRF